MNPKRLAKLRRQAMQAVEGSRGDGFAEVVLELVEYIEELNQVAESAVELDEAVNQLAPEPVAEPVASNIREEFELVPTHTPKRKRKVAEAGGDLSGSD
jgi:thiamine monophosphate kinase